MSVRHRMTGLEQVCLEISPVRTCITDSLTRSGSACQPSWPVLPALESIESKRHTSYRSYSKKVYTQNHLSIALIWERLHELKLYSLQRRRERYIIIYIWKITHMKPNIDGTIGHTIKTGKYQKHGTQCVIQYPTNRNPAQSLQENTITVFGPRLYNSLPKYLRDIESVPDQPKIPNYVTASGSNSILDQLTHLKKQFTTVVESPTRPWSCLRCFEATPRIQESKYQINMVFSHFHGIWDKHNCTIPNRCCEVIYCKILT